MPNVMQLLSIDDKDCESLMIKEQVELCFVSNSITKFYRHVGSLEIFLVIPMSFVESWSLMDA